MTQQQAEAVAAAVAAQQAQRGLAALVLRDMAAAWQRLNVAKLKQSRPLWVATVAGIVHRYGSASGALSVEFYNEARHAAGARSAFSVPVADIPTLDHVSSVMDWATRGLWSEQPDVEAAKTLADGAASKLTLDVGRQTIVDAVEQDKVAHGWARVARPSSCFFCAMLATRGAVYRSEQSAHFEAHDHCTCYVEPLFGAAYEAPAHVRQWESLYRESTAGKSGHAARLAFRQAFEGRAR